MGESPQNVGTSQETIDEDNQLSLVYAVAIQLLRVGFGIAAVLFVCGLVWSAIEREALADTVEPLQDLPGLIMDGEPAAVIDLAIVALMLTPVVTVLGVAVGMFRVGDRRYGVLSLVVLLVLIASIGLALAR